MSVLFLLLSVSSLIMVLLGYAMGNDGLCTVGLVFAIIAIVGGVFGLIGLL